MSLSVTEVHFNYAVNTGVDSCQIPVRNLTTVGQNDSQVGLEEPVYELGRDQFPWTYWITPFTDY